MHIMKNIAKTILYPVRKITSKFVHVDDDFKDSIIYKAANIIAKEKIRGEYLEFGVFEGSSFIYAYNIIKYVFEEQAKYSGIRTETELVEARKTWDAMRFFAFDSFQGLPLLTGVDAQSNIFAKGKYACSEVAFLSNLRKAKIPLNRVVSVAGWFDQTCTIETAEKYQMSKAALIHIDCDLYESTRTVLGFIQPLLTDGTILIFDDWYFFRGNPNLGEQRAFNEWRKTLQNYTFTEYQKEGPFRNSFIANQIQ